VPVVTVGHPIPGLTANERIGRLQLAFIGGRTGQVTVTSTQQTQLVALGYVINPATPNYESPYVLDADLPTVLPAAIAAEVAKTTGPTATALRAAFVPAISIVGKGADPTGATDSRAAIVAAITLAATSGLPVFVPKGTFRKDGAAIPIPSGVEVYGAGATSIIKNGPSPTAAIFTNSDTAAGNNGIRLHHLKLDANGPSASSGQFSVVEMDNLVACEFDQLEVTGGRNDGVTAGSGSGLRIQRMTRSHIGRIYAHDVDYDGVLLGGCTDNVIDSVHGVDCKRNALQLSRYPIGSGTTPSLGNVVGRVIAEHSTGIPGGTSPTTGAVYFHNSQYNQVGEVFADGVRMAVGGIGTDGGSCVGNIVGSVVARTRYVTSAVIDWEGECYRNQIGRAVIRPISGAAGIYVRVVGPGSFNLFRSIHAFIGGGTGANATDCDIEMIDAAGAPSITDAGQRNLVRYTAAGQLFVKKTGVAAVTVA